MELVSKADPFESLITFIANGSYVRVDLKNLSAVVLGRTNAVDGVVPTCGGETGTGPNFSVVQCSSKRFVRSIITAMQTFHMSMRFHSNQLATILGSF